MVLSGSLIYKEDNPPSPCVVFHFITFTFLKKKTSYSLNYYIWKLKIKIKFFVEIPIPFQIPFPISFPLVFKEARKMDQDFLPPSQIPPTQLLEEDPLSVPVPVPREYDQIILYCWHPPHGMKPFKEYSKSRFTDKEIRDEWYKFQIKPECRARKLKCLKSFTPNSMSLYAKVEKSK